MREIQYQSAKNGGRSGHIFKDLFTSVILAKLLDAKAVRSQYWNEQTLISPENAEQFLARPRWGIQQETFSKSEKFWRGICWKEFLSFREYFDALPDPCRVRITSVYRIHLCQIKNWEERGRIEAGVYEALVGTLRKLYWGQEVVPEPSSKVRKIVIHARRGDVALPSSSYYNTMGPGKWSAKFYQEKIDGLRARYPEASIRLLTEESQSADLDTVVGAEIDKGDAGKLSAHFREMVTADLIMPANSSLSTWAAYLTQGLVAISPSHSIKDYHFNNRPANHIEL